MTAAKRMPADSTDWGSESDSPPAPMTVKDAQKAHEVIKPYLAATPLLENPVLSERLGAKAFVKLENSQAMGAFKIRGAINLLASMDEETRKLGLVTATRGNFGSALAEACAMYGARCTVFVPEGNSPDKNTAVKALGGEIVVKGHDFDAAWDASVRYAWDHGAVSVHPAKRVELVAGQATVALEMIEQAGDPLDYVFVPVGGGSLAAGTTTIFKALSPSTKVIAVQAENAPAFHHAWHSKKYTPMVAAKTIADGLATRVPVRYTLDMMRDLDDFMLVSEEEICAAIRCYAQTIHQLAEGAGAATLAAAMKMKDSLAGKRVGMVLTGGNIDNAALMQALQIDSPLHTPHAVPHFPMSSLDYGH